MANEKIYSMSFGKIYPLLINKAVRKGRTAGEVRFASQDRFAAREIEIDLLRKIDSLRERLR